MVEGWIVMEHLWNGNMCGVTTGQREEYIPLLVFVHHKLHMDLSWGASDKSYEP